MKHQDIIRKLKQDIAERKFPDGKLPSEAALCRRFAAARETVRRALRKALDGANAPDAIVCGNDETAVRLIASLRRLDRRIPADVAVVGFDDIPMAATAEPPLTTIRQPTGEIARTALRALFARIRYPNAEPREINVSAKLIVRASS